MDQLMVLRIKRSTCNYNKPQIRFNEKRTTRRHNLLIRVLTFIIPSTMHILCVHLQISSVSSRREIKDGDVNIYITSIFGTVPTVFWCSKKKRTQMADYAIEREKFGNFRMTTLSTTKKNFKKIVKSSNLGDLPTTLLFSIPFSTRFYNRATFNSFFQKKCSSGGVNGLDHYPFGTLCPYFWRRKKCDSIQREE